MADLPQKIDDPERIEILNRLAAEVEFPVSVFQADPHIMHTAASTDEAKALMSAAVAACREAGRELDDMTALPKRVAGGADREKVLSRLATKLEFPARLLERHRHLTDKMITVQQVENMMIETVRVRKGRGLETGNLS